VQELLGSIGQGLGCGRFCLLATRAAVACPAHCPAEQHTLQATATLTPAEGQRGSADSCALGFLQQPGATVLAWQPLSNDLVSAATTPAALVPPEAALDQRHAVQLCFYPMC
jgi:hypothetical protein